MIEKLKWITWSIMPLVYDESLSYVELLDKVIAKLNEVIEATNNFTKPVQETIDAWLKSDEGQAAVEQSVGDFIVAYSKTPSFQQVLVSALENQSAEVKAAASEAAEAYLKSPEGKTALDTEIRDYMLVYTKTDEFKNLIGEYVMELNDILRGDRLDIRQKNSTTIQTPNTVISSAEIANDYSAGSAKSRVEVNSSGVHIYSDEDMSTPAISASGGVVELGKNLDAKTHRIINLPTPEAAHEAANKFYVDQAIAEIPGGGGGGGGGGAGVIVVNVSRNSQGIWTASRSYASIASNLNAGNVVKVNITGAKTPNDLMCSSYTSSEVKFTGVIAIAWPEVAVTGRHQPSRYYVTTVTISNNDQVSVDDTEWNSAYFIQTDGSIPFTNEQSMGNNQLRDLAAPTRDTDAATKGYVDSHGGGGGSGGGGGVSLGEIRLTDLDDAQSGVVYKYDPQTDSYVFEVQNDEDNANNLTGYNLEIFNQLKEACSEYITNVDLGGKPVNATITFGIKLPTDKSVTHWAVNISESQLTPAESGGFEVALFGKSAAWDELPNNPRLITYSEISFILVKVYSKAMGKFTYVFKAYLSNPNSRLLTSWGVGVVSPVYREWPSGAMYAHPTAAPKIDTKYVLNGQIPSVLLIYYENNVGNPPITHRSCIVAHGCNDGEFDEENNQVRRNLKFIADYPALNNPNVTFHTTFSGYSDIAALPMSVKTTASGVPDVIDGTITVGEDGTISALTLNGLNKTLLNGIWSWKDEWDCSSELSLTYLTVGEKNYKYTFKLARAYKVNPSSATDTMYGLDFECDKGDYKMVITQTFDTASETVPAATYKTVKYGGNDSGGDSGGGGTTDSAMWEAVADDKALIGMFNKSTTINLSKPCREIALYSEGFSTGTGTTKPSLTIKTNNNKEYKFDLATGDNVKIVATAKNDQGVLTASVVKTKNLTDTFLYTNADANALFNSIIVNYTGIENTQYTSAKLRIKGR